MKALIIDTQKEIRSSQKITTIEDLQFTIRRASAHKDTSIKIYLENEEEYSAIFSWHDRNKWKIDYPIQLGKIHKQRYVTNKQCLQLADYIYKGKSVDEIKAFYDVPVRHFTLDEMLAFKKEDEMMLKGVDPYVKSNVPKEVEEKTSSSKKEQPKTESKKKPKGRIGLEGVPKNTPKKTKQKSLRTKPATSFDFDFGTKEKIEKVPTKKSTVKSKTATRKPVKKVAKTQEQEQKISKKQSETPKIVSKKPTKRTTTKKVVPKKQQVTKSRKGKEILELGAEKSKTVAKKTKTTKSTLPKKSSTATKKKSSGNDSLLEL